MPTLVRASPLAQQQIDRLKRRDRKRFDQFVEALTARGCAALAYRLTGDMPLRLFCVAHLTGQLRVVVGFSSSEEAWVVLVGPHDNDPGLDVYTALYSLAGVAPPDDVKRTKPSCCDVEDGEPPLFDSELLEDLARRAARLRRR
jgi:hypothetical protein